MPHSYKSLSLSSCLLTWLPLLAICVVFTYYFWFLDGHAANIPYQDDIADFLQFIISVENADSAREAFMAGFRQYNDHRVGATRLLVYGAYLMQGEVNFRTLILVANLAAPLILLLFYLAIREDEYCWVFLLVSTLLLLHLKFYTIAFMSQLVFAYYFVFLYGFACFFTLHRVSKLKFVLAAAFCTLSSFTLASGQIVWLLGLASLLHQCLPPGRRSLWYPLAWVIVAIAMLIVWRLGVVVSDTVTTGEELRAMFPDYVGDASLVKILHRHAIFFLSFTGSALINFSVFWAAVAGSAMLLLLICLSYRSIRDEDIRLVLCCWFAVATLAAATLGRAMVVDSDTILHTRYNFFSLMLLCPLVLLTLTRFAVFRTYAVFLVVGLALMYSVAAWRNSQEWMQAELNRLYGGFNSGQYPVAYMVGTKSNAIVEEAIAKGIYRPPCKPFPTCEYAAER